MNLDEARARATKLYDDMPLGFRLRLSEDPSFKEWLVRDITQEITKAHREGYEEGYKQAAADRDEKWLNAVDRNIARNSPS